MLAIRVLGAHCFNCEWLAQETQHVLDTLVPRPTYELLKIADPFEIAAYGVLRLPALVINDRVMCAGRLPRREQVLGWIHQVQEATASESNG